MNKKSIIAVITACIMLLLLIIPAGTAFAADVSDMDFITSVQLTERDGDPFGASIAKNAQLRLEYEYQIPNTYPVHTDDTFTMQIPTEIAVTAPGAFSLTDDTSGDIIGNGTIAMDGTLVITFTSFVETYSNIHGNFWFDLAFDEDDIGNENPVAITFSVGATTPPYVIEVEFEQPAPVPATVTKSGSYNASTKQVTWTLNVGPSDVTATNVIVTDVIPAGQTYVDGSLTVNGGAPDPMAFTYDAGTGTLTYTLGDITAPQTLVFRTLVDDSVFDPAYEGTTVTLHNQAALNQDGQPEVLSNDATVTTAIDYIRKAGTYNGPNRRITWTITVDNNYVELNNATVTDVIPDGLTIDTDSVYRDTTIHLVRDVDFTYDDASRTFTYSFPDTINSPHTISFYTYVTDPTVYDHSGTTNYINTAEIVWDGVTDGPGGTSNPVGAVSTLIDKQGVAALYNDATGELTWRIYVNRNNITINNCVVTDVMPAGLEFVDGSVTIGGAAADPADYTYIGNTFTYYFGNITAQQYIEFRTRITDVNFYKNNATRTFSNTATVTGDGIDPTPDNGTQNVTSQIIAKSCTGYDYTTRQFTWQIVVNRNENEMTNAIVTDDISLAVIGGVTYSQRFVPGSVMLDGVSISPPAYTYTDTPGDPNRTGTLELNLGNINTQHTITFNTVIDDLSVFATNGDRTFSNTARLVHLELPGGATGTNSRTVHNTVISKSGSYTSGNRYIDWEVILNTNTIDLLEDADITDVLQEGLVLDTNTIRLFHMTVNPDGSLTDGSEVDLSPANVEYDIATRTLTFHIPAPVSGAYKLTMRTNVTVERTYTNSASFSGTGTNQTGTTGGIVVAWAGSGSSGTGETGSIRVYKVDRDNNSIHLEGCEFELIDRYGNVINRGTTGIDGYTLFNMLRFGVNYTVREVTPPEGYLISDELYTFSIGSEDETVDIEYNYSDEAIMGSITLTKYDFDMEPVPGTGFTLYNELGSAVMTALSGADGAVHFENVPYGEYTVRETAPAPGYYGSGDVLTASVIVDGEMVITTPAFIQNEAFLSRVRMLKYASDSVTPLGGARFGLYRSTDTSFSSPVATDISTSDGEVLFVNIKYGDYVIREISAPPGYAVSRVTVPVQVRADGVTVNAGTFTDRRRPPEDSPDTGDSILLYGGIFIACIAGLIVIAIKRNHKKAARTVGAVIDRRKSEQ